MSLLSCVSEEVASGLIQKESDCHSGSRPEMMEEGTEMWPSRDGVQRGCAYVASKGAHPTETPEDAIGRWLPGS